MESTPGGSSHPRYREVPFTFLHTSWQPWSLVLSALKHTAKVSTIRITTTTQLTASAFPLRTRALTAPHIASGLNRVREVSRVATLDIAVSRHTFTTSILSLSCRRHIRTLIISIQAPSSHFDADVYLPFESLHRREHGYCFSLPSPPKHSLSTSFPKNCPIVLILISR